MNTGRPGDIVSDALLKLAASVSPRTRPAAGGWRWPVLSSVGADGAPQSRILVLRGVQQNPLNCLFYTDYRSAKVKALLASPVASLLFFDTEGMVQMRAEVIMHLHHGDDLADQHWQGLPDRSIVEYASVAPPGAALSSPDELTHDEGVAQRHFAVLRASLVRLDILQLRHDGHRRVQAHQQGGPWQAQWVVP